MSVEAKLTRLSIDLNNTNLPAARGASKPKADETPDSWEDDAANDSPVEAPGPSLKQITSNDSPGPPPPTPISPQDGDLASRRWEAKSYIDSGKPTPRWTSTEQGGADKRPEKSTATANRLIAGALGIRAPKKTEEQRQYEKAIKEAEIRRKNREKEQREIQKLEDEKAQAAIWEA